MKFPQYFLRREVFFCFSDKNVVFRDIRGDDYFALPITTTSAFKAALAGWPKQIEVDLGEAKASIDDSYLALEEMLIQGFLTKDPAKGKEAIPFISTAPRASLRKDDATVSAESENQHAMEFFTAARDATDLLRACENSPEVGPWKITLELLDMIRTRREKNASAWNTAKAQTLATIAQELRPWFDEKPVCTLDSLVVIEFFARHDLYPDWVFGIRANPPDAHCWVQHKDMLVNDTVDVVTQFTPIMAI